MSKPHKKHRLATDARQAHAERVKRRDRRLLIRGGIALAVAIPLAVVGVMQYEKRAAVRYDLSVIGNGQPTVVQVMDHGCSECRKLSDNLSPIRREFDGRVQFRLADRGRTDGAILATRHNAGHVTLLMFDGNGRLRTTLTGIQEAGDIRTAILSSFPGVSVAQ